MGVLHNFAQHTPWCTRNLLPKSTLTIINYTSSEMNVFLILLLCVSLANCDVFKSGHTNNESVSFTKCYEVSACLISAGITTYNVEDWPINICYKDYLMKCLIKNKGSCGNQLKNIFLQIKQVCYCVNAIKKCEPKLENIFNLKSTKEISKVPGKICKNIEPVGDCLIKSTTEYSCSLKSAGIANVIRAISGECSIQECIDMHGGCWKQSYDIAKSAFDEIKVNSGGILALESLCSQYEKVVACYDTPVTTGTCQLGFMLKSYIMQMKIVCQRLPDIKAYGKCFGKLGNFIEDFYKKQSSITDLKDVRKNLMESSIDNQFCGAPLVDFNTCISKTTVSLPSEFVKIKQSVEYFCKYQGCTEGINKCFKNISTGIEVDIQNGKIALRNPNLLLLCKYRAKVESCIEHTLSTAVCSNSQIKQVKESIQMSKMFCNLPCMQTNQKCVNSIADNLFKPRKQPWTIHQCKADSEMKECLSEIKNCANHPAIRTFTCENFVCSNAMMKCGIKSLESIKEISFNKEGITRICREIKNIQICLIGINQSGCFQKSNLLSISDYIKEVVIRKCNTLAGMINPLIPTQTEKNFITLSVRVEKPFEEYYYDLTNINSLKIKESIEQSLSKIYKHQEGFKSVHVVRFYPGSLGFDFTIEMNEELEKDLVFNRAKQYVKSLEDTPFNIDNEEVELLDTPLFVVKGKALDIHNACALIDYNCENGKCEIINGKATCVCEKTHAGKYCTETKYDLSASTTVAFNTLVLSICIMIVSMVI